MINIIISCLIFAIWSVILFLEKSIGISALLFIAPFTYYLVYILEKNDKIKNKKAKLLLIPIDLLALTYFLFDNDLKSYNALAILGLIIAMLILLYNDKFTFTKIIENFVNIYVYPCVDFFTNLKTTKDKVLSDLDKNKEKKDREKTKKYLSAIGYTLLISAIVIVLLSSADNGFSELFEWAIDFSIGIIEKFKIMDFVLRVFLIFVVFIYLVGMIKNILEYKIDESKANDNNGLVKDSLTLKMILTSLNCIYLLFFIVQIKEFIDFKNNLNYAEFARKGFFELMAVSIINFITIIIAKNSEKKENNRTYFKSMELVMIFFTFILLISAGIRMHIYESTFGYTHLRFLVYFSLFTEILILIPTIMYVLDKNVDLIKTSFVIVTVMYVALNFINMDSFIAKKNIDRYFETGKIDFDYLKYNTGMDAIPEITRLLDVKDKDLKKFIKGYLKTISNELDEEDRSIVEFNLSRYNAKKCLDEK